MLPRAGRVQATVWVTRRCRRGSGQRGYPQGDRQEGRREPGRDRGYHPASGWIVLGEIIQRLDGRPLAEALRARVPGIEIASDFIVGYPGESDEDFEKTVSLLREVEFQNSFVFKYSPRPGTVADKRSYDDVGDQVKRRRNADLLACQERISAAANQKLIGSTAGVLVEGYSKAAIKAQEAEQTSGHEVAVPLHPPLVKGGRRGGRA